MNIGFNKALIIDTVGSKARKRTEINDEEFMTGGGKNDVPEKSTFNSLTFPVMKQMYKVNVWIRSCVDRIVTRSVDVKPLVKTFNRDGTKKITDEQKIRIDEIHSKLLVPNSNKQSFDHIRRQVFKDVLVWDAAALEFVKDKSEITDFYAVSGDTIRKNVNMKGEFKNFKESYLQKDINNKTIAKLSIDELAYFMLNPSSGSVYGLSPLESLRQTVTADLYAEDYNIKTFFNQATPRFAVLFDNLGMGQGQPALERLRAWWDKELKGKPHKPILLGSEKGSIRFERVGLTNEEMQYQEYSRWLLSKIMAIYKMQAAVLGIIEVNQGRINAAYQEQQFKKDAVSPLLRMFSNQLNTLLVWSRNNYGFNDVYIDWEGLDDIDRKLLAEIHEVYLRQGVLTINMVLEELGREPVPWGNTPYLLNQMIQIDSNGNTIENVEKIYKLLKYFSSGKLNLPTGLEKMEDTNIVGLAYGINKLLKNNKVNKLIESHKEFQQV